MARWAVCRCGEGGAITVVGAGERSRTIGPGSRVDLDEVILPAAGTRPAQTLGDAVAADIHLFEVEEAERGQQQYDHGSDDTEI